MSRVLVVDDEEAYRALMAGHLERKGMDVTTAENGSAALDIFDTEGPFDVIVTDMMMPNMSGLDLLTEIKQREPTTEVIVITASNEISKAVAAMREGGAFDYLLKPLESIGELSFTVGRALQHRQLLEERQRLHQELDREASRLQALVTYSGEAMLLADANGQITVANPAAIELLGHDDLVGAIASDVLAPELRSLIEAWHEMGGQEPAVIELEWPSSITSLVSIAPVGLPGEEQTGWVMIMRDITHLKQIDDLKLRMLSDAAGKIRLPLAQAISKLADLSGGAIKAEDDRNTTIYQLSSVLGRIQNWMDEMLALVQVEAGIGFSSEIQDLEDALNDRLKLNFDEVHQGKGICLELKIPEDLPKVRVDPRLFERMLTGLLDRAAQRSQVGGVVMLTARLHQRHMWIEISDQGFSKIRRIDAAAREDSWETDGISYGFDLRMVRTIVQKLGGQVWVRGQDGMGSTLAISLPVVEASA
ncbi:MAG: response regulator [Anaerolineales bacterium]|nr:MAG: response regulator [Anaerolineales bacterium]